MRVVGNAAVTGSLAVAKQADPIGVRTDGPRLTPVFPGPAGNLQPKLVHVIRGGDVDLTSVAGRVVVGSRRLLTDDLRELISEANRAGPELLSRRGAWLESHKPVNEVGESQTAHTG